MCVAMCEVRLWRAELGLLAPALGKWFVLALP
jgi:hypothetical protein